MLKKLLPFALLAFVGCAKIQFTDTVRRGIETADSTALGRVQFYINKQINLQNTSSTSNSTISNGVVKYQNGQYSTTVYIKKGLPVVAKTPLFGKIIIQVSTGTDETLLFVNTGGDYNLYTAKDGTVSYGGQRFTVTQGSDAALQIKKSDSTKKGRKVNFAKGVRVK
jgi:hypothetical protein